MYKSAHHWFSKIIGKKMRAFDLELISFEAVLKPYLILEIQDGF